MNWYDYNEGVLYRIDLDDYHLEWWNSSHSTEYYNNYNLDSCNGIKHQLLVF